MEIGLGNHKYNIGEMVRVPDYNINNGIVIAIQYHLDNDNKNFLNITYDIWYYDEYGNNTMNSYLESQILEWE